jgi:hypothetical protein
MLKTALTFSAFIGALAAVINVSEIPKNPDVKGWAFGIGLLVFVGCLAWASVS